MERYLKAAGTVLLMFTLGFSLWGCADLDTDAVQAILTGAAQGVQQGATTTLPPPPPPARAGRTN